MATKITQLKIYRYTRNPEEINETDGTYGKGYVLIRRGAPAGTTTVSYTITVTKKSTGVQVYTYSGTWGIPTRARLPIDAGTDTVLDLEEEYDYTISVSCASGDASATCTIKKGKRFITLDPDLDAIGLGTEPVNRNCVEVPDSWSLFFGETEFSPWSQGTGTVDAILIDDFNDLIIPGKYNVVWSTSLEHAPADLTTGTGNLHCIVYATKSMQSVTQIIFAYNTTTNTQAAYVREYTAGYFHAWYKFALTQVT